MLTAFKRRFLPNGLVPVFRRYGGSGLFDLLYETGARVYGWRIRLEASSICQLKCPACSTASGVNKQGVVGAGHLQADHFRRLLEAGGDIKRLKQKHKSPYPKLYRQFIIFGHNEHELPRARRLARKLGMKFRPKLNHTPELFPVQDRAFVRRESGFQAADRQEYKERNKKGYSYPCGQLWSNPQINWDGKLLGCCVNKYGDFGNVFEIGLRKGLRSEKYRYAGAMILGKVPPRKDMPCYTCKVYRKLNEEACA